MKKRNLLYAIMLFLFLTANILLTDSIDVQANEDVTQKTGFRAPDLTITDVEVTSETVDESGGKARSGMASDSEESEVSLGEGSSFGTSYTVIPLKEKSKIVAEIRENMVERENTFTVCYEESGKKDDRDYLIDLANEIFIAAFDETGNAKEGCYLMYNYGGAGMTLQSIYYTRNNVTQVTITYYVNYYTTAKQEEAVDAKVNKIIRELGLKGPQSKYEKVRLVYEYLTDTVEYDYEHFRTNRNYYLMYTAYAALIDEICVCQGYANAMYRILNEAGVQTLIVTEKENMDHAWNIVKLGDYYYHCDSTWDAEEKYWYYFLKGEPFLHHETPDEYKNVGTWMNTYPLSSTDYVSTGNEEAEDVILDATEKLTAALTSLTSVHLEWKSVDYATAYRVYYRKYGEVQYDLLTETTQTNFSKSGLSRGTTYKFKVVAVSTFAGADTVISSKSKTVNIKTKPLLSKITTFKTYLYGYDDVLLKWNKTSGADGYAVYFKKSTSDEYTFIKRTTSISYKKSGLTDGIKYQFKVVPYIKVNGKYYYGYSKTSDIYTLKKISAAKVTRYSSGKVKVSWSNINGESGYQISRSTSKNKTSVACTYATTSGKSKVLSVSKNKTYYYKVRAYRVGADGKKVYGPWSDTVKYKCK